MWQPLLPVSLVLALTMTIAQAQAHARLEKAAPPVGGTVTSSPSEIRLTFSEGVEPRLSGIVLTDAGGKKAATGKPMIDPKDKAELVVPLPQPLAPGVYKVEWRAVSADTHKTRGAFSFTVKP